MIWSDLHGDMQSAAEMTAPPSRDGATNVNGPKVRSSLALVKPNHMRESPLYSRPVLAWRRPGESESGGHGDNPQGRPGSAREPSET